LYLLIIAAWTSALENNIDEQLTGAPSQAAAQIAKVFIKNKKNLKSCFFFVC